MDFTSYGNHGPRSGRKTLENLDIIFKALENYFKVKVEFTSNQLITSHKMIDEFCALLQQKIRSLEEIYLEVIIYGCLKSKRNKF